MWQSKANWMRSAMACVVLMLAWSGVHAEDEQAAAVRVGALVYGQGQMAVCFAEGFLQQVAAHTEIAVEPHMYAVELSSADVFDYPFVVMTGPDGFTLSDEEVQQLRDYLTRGGFVLASAGCSNAQWAESFHEAMKLVLPEAKLEPLPMDHAVFHTLFDIETVRTTQVAEDPAIYGLTLEGRLVMIFSPFGLNDTANAGKGCCCCGGNEVRDAGLINANLLVYALTH